MKRTERESPSSPDHSLPHRLRYWKTHGAVASPTETIAARFSSELDDGSLSDLADEVGLPVATVRGTGSFYADLQRDDSAGPVVYVCDGTSCRLSGGAVLEETERRCGHRCRKVYCLGLCDRSPASVMNCELLRERERTVVRCAAPTPIVTARILDGPVREIQAAIRAGVYKGLTAALASTPEHLLEQVELSGERGRGGAGFSTGTKWRSATRVESAKRYVIANGDEGDPGSFVDRVLMEDDPHSIIEGMLLCGYAIGADEGIVYIRSEYPQAISTMTGAVDAARDEGLLGTDICGSGFNFDVRVFEGKGSYVCGEETALINSLEGLRGEVQIRPPYPTEYGLYGKPTVINNVETLINIPFIARKGGAAYAFFGTTATCGTKAICLNHGFANPGLVEVEFGITFREVIEEIGGGGQGGEPLAAVLVGGSMGTLLKPQDWDLPVCLDVLSRHNIQLGHGGMVAIPESSNFRDLLVHLVEFMVRESCGKCVPCRLGSQALLNAVKEERSPAELVRMLDFIENGSLCAFGQFVPGPIRTLINDFGERISAT